MAHFDTGSFQKHVFIPVLANVYIANFTTTIVFSKKPGVKRVGIEAYT
jgi:hypothetical protein